MAEFGSDSPSAAPCSHPSWRTHLGQGCPHPVCPAQRRQMICIRNPLDLPIVGRFRTGASWISIADLSPMNQMQQPARQAETAIPINLDIAGMSCASCASRIEKALERADGVISANVNLANEKATIVADLSRTSARALAQVVNDTGYKAVTSHRSLQIGGMTCASCVARVERALGRVPGVVSVSVNLASERADIETVGDVSSESLLAAIDDAGYEAKLADES